jgi:uncharacterized protein (TIGR03382 family)
MNRLLTLSLLALPIVAHGYVLKLDAAGKPVFWGTSPTFVVDPGLAAQIGVPDTESAARAAVATYAADLPQLGISLQVAATHGVGYDPTPGAINENAIVPIDHDWPYDPNAIAVTIITVNPQTDEILDADIALNTAAHTFAALPDDSSIGGPYDDLQNTLTHELGHALGLAHNTTDATVVMYPGAPTGQVSKRVLASDDKAGLAFLYGSAASPTTPEGAPAVGCQSVAAGPWAIAAVLALVALSRRRTAAVTARR